MALAVSPLSNRQPRHSTVSPMDIDGAAAASGLNISCGTLEILSASGRVECSPFQKSTHLLAYGSDTHISVVQRFDNVDGPDEHPEKPSKHSPLDRWMFSHILSLRHGTRVDAVAWSPISRTQANGEDTLMCFATAGQDKRIRHFKMEESTSEEVQQIAFDGHLEPINALSFCPIQHSFLATTGDDNVCKIWDVERQLEASIFRLSSAGTAVRWHPEDENQLLVSEIAGSMKLLDIRAGVPVTTLTTESIPLKDADWNPFDATLVGCVAGRKWFVWDLSLGRLLETAQPHGDGSSQFRWSTSRKHAFATCGDFDVWIWDLTHPEIDTSYMRIQRSRVGGISWLGTLNCCVTTGDNQLFFYFAY